MQVFPPPSKNQKTKNVPRTSQSDQFSRESFASGLLITALKLLIEWVANLRPREPNRRSHMNIPLPWPNRKNEYLVGS